MAQYKNSDGNDYTAIQYCQPSWQARNVDETNQKMGYLDLSDRANRDKEPTGLHGEKSRKQIMADKFGY